MNFRIHKTDRDFTNYPAVLVQKSRDILRNLVRSKYPFQLSNSFANLHISCKGPLARYVNLRVAHVPGRPGTFSPPPRVSDPGMHHGTCVTCDACRDRYVAVSFEGGGGENVSGIPSACATRNFTYLVRGPWQWYCRALCQFPQLRLDVV